MPSLVGSEMCIRDSPRSARIQGAGSAGLRVHDERCLHRPAGGGEGGARRPDDAGGQGRRGAYRRGGRTGGRAQRRERVPKPAGALRLGRQSLSGECAGGARR